MDATEYNNKYALVLSGFGRLRSAVAVNQKWGIKTDPLLSESCKLFLYLRTLMRYVPGINLSDREVDILFTKALTLISCLNIEDEPVLTYANVEFSATCGCEGGISSADLSAIISGGKKPDPFSIFYDEPRWNVDHNVFTEPKWAGLTFKVMSNTDNRFLNAQDGFQVLPTGGFSITNPMYDGQEFIPVF